MTPENGRLDLKITKLAVLGFFKVVFRVQIGSSDYHYGPFELKEIIRNISTTPLHLWKLLNIQGVPERMLKVKCL